MITLLHDYYMRNFQNFAVYLDANMPKVKLL